jgi:hypothetical protein
MITSLIRKNYKSLQIYGASLGALAGFVLLLSVGQFYVEMDNVMEANRDLIDPEYIVINKQVSFMETFNLREATFSEEEILEIRQQPWAEKVEGFISNQFALSAFTDSERFPDFYTDLFFEAIPAEYLDVKDEDWKWEPGDRIIPIILPQEYLNLYNFGFAPSQGLPQISPQTISLVGFTINIRGKGKSKEFRGKIIGFSNRINSVLVPYDFLTWANDNYGFRSSEKISRLVIVTRDPTNPEIVSFLENKGYETIKEKLKSSRLNIILKFIISFLGTLGFFIIFLAFLVFVLSFQLMIARSAEKIQKLKWIGYHYLEISRPYIRNFAIILLILSALTTAILYLLKSMLGQYISEWGISLTEGFHPWVISGGFLLVLLIFIFNSLAIIRQTRKI